jgi:DNA-binding NtrC family response regulator
LPPFEEIDTLSHELQSVAFDQAKDWLADNDSPDIKSRLKAARRKVTRQPQSKSQPLDIREVLFNKRYDFHDEVLKFERSLISETLAKVGGKVTHAAKLLGIPDQYLAFIIETKHPDLLKKRTPIRRRPRRKKVRQS